MTQAGFIIVAIILGAAAVVYLAVVLNALSSVSRRKGRDGREHYHSRYGSAYYSGYHRRRSPGRRKGSGARDQHSKRVYS